MLTRRLFILICFSSYICNASAQENKATQFPSKYFEEISKKTNDLQQKLNRKSQKVLDRVKRIEEKLKRKLEKSDSLAAVNLFSDAEAGYRRLEERSGSSKTLTQYVPRLDTLIAGLKFLEQDSGWLGEERRAKVNNALSSVTELESQLQKAGDIKNFIRERKQFLKEQIENFGFDKQFKKIDKQLYYYTQQLNEYKEILKDPKKIGGKAIEVLANTKLFQDFFRSNSQLASLFPMPGNANNPGYTISLAGLQSRAQVNSFIQNQVAAGGASAQQQFRDNLQAAQTQLQQVKDKINKWGGTSSEDVVPENFKPNDQKTKSFWQRIEIGSNIQSQRATNLFPVTSDLGLSLGYKLNDEAIVGVGASYKIGWGSDWSNILITHQGVGIRSFIDWRIKGSFWMSGGYEQNYKPVIRSIDQLKDQSSWQTSGLIGISKVISIKSKIFKKTKLQLLWDFLSHSQIPRGQPILFRIGYNIK